MCASACASFGKMHMHTFNDLMLGNFLDLGCSSDRTMSFNQNIVREPELDYKMS